MKPAPVRDEEADRLGPVARCRSGAGRCCVLERHLAAHLNESYAVGFTACNARLIDGQGKLIAGCVY